jgi:hypothetical protein
MDARLMAKKVLHVEKKAKVVSELFPEGWGVKVFEGAISRLRAQERDTDSKRRRKTDNDDQEGYSIERLKEKKGNV